MCPGPNFGKFSGMGKIFFVPAGDQVGLFDGPDYQESP